MNVILNGTARELPAGATAGDAARLVTAGRPGVAVAVNDDVVSRAAWDSTPLADGDRVEILTAVQGG
ncbi:MAG: sulfur carrier protein ThiS [Actinobacteria bacterium]|nr:sulfur carrier protein ThiS [Actinomycetota bacterium]